MVESVVLCINSTGQFCDANVKIILCCDFEMIWILFYRQDDVKWGELVGEDKYGNKYFQNNTYFYGTYDFWPYPDTVLMNLYQSVIVFFLYFEIFDR